MYLTLLNSKDFDATNDPKSSGSFDSNSNDDTTKPAIVATTEAVILEHVDSHPYDLSYTCLLLPRLVSHTLTGDMATGLEPTLKQICFSSGWRLEFFEVQPGYLQWTMRVPPTASTSHFMQVIREQTSQYIFIKFPNFKSADSQIDFWAPGYLIVWGSQQHPVEIIQRYIQQSRQQQGSQPHA